MPDEMLPWEVILSDVASKERSDMFLELGRKRGVDYARRWWSGLLAATDGIAPFPGPRSLPSCTAESERRRAEVRYRTYGGPDKRASTSASCHIFFAVYDPWQGDAVGRLIILRVVGARTQAAADILTGRASEL
jgi:plasmid stabilization system protein ParE